jgi:hypothetical protein
VSAGHTGWQAFPYRADRSWLFTARRRGAGAPIRYPAGSQGEDGSMADPHDALIAALEAAGLPVQSLSQQERAMLATLTDEEVTLLIALRTRKAEEVPVCTDESDG